MNPPTTRPVFKRIEETTKNHQNGIGHAPVTRARTPKLHTARRCEQRAQREQNASRSISKDELAPCLKHKEKILSPMTQPKLFQKGKVKKVEIGDDLGTKQKNGGVSNSPRRKKMQSEFFDSFIANQIFNTPQRKHFQRQNFEKLPQGPPVAQESKDPMNGVGRSLWNKKERNQDDTARTQKNCKLQQLVERNGYPVPPAAAVSRVTKFEGQQEQKQDSKAFTTPQNKVLQENKNDNCTSVSQESKVEAMLNLLIIDGKHTRELINKVREGADESELLAELALKENNLYDLRHLIQEGKSLGKRKSIGGGSAKCSQRSVKKK